MNTPIPSETDIQQRLSPVEPDVEVLLVEQIAAERIRLVIDRPDGVDLATCQRVTGHLGDLLAEFAVEVSSPGPERPLTKPEHYRRYTGRRARIRVQEPREGRKNFTGELLDASEDEVTLAAEDGIVAIPYIEINRSNLLEG